MRHWKKKPEFDRILFGKAENSVILKSIKNTITNILNKVSIPLKDNKLFEKRCKNCNISRFCSICYAQCCQEKGFKKEIKECKLNEVAVRDKMKTYIDLLEESPGIFEEITVDYYNEIHRKMSGCFEF